MHAKQEISAHFHGRRTKTAPSISHQSLADRYDLARVVRALIKEPISYRNSRKDVNDILKQVGYGRSRLARGSGKPYAVSEAM